MEKTVTLCDVICPILFSVSIISDSFTLHHFFVSRKNDFFWRVITYLLLRDNKNISPQYNILNNVQNNA